MADVCDFVFCRPGSSVRALRQASPAQTDEQRCRAVQDGTHAGIAGTRPRALGGMSVRF